MAKAPCARLMKFIRPIVTDRPMLMMNSRLPYAMPSNRTPARFPSITPALRARRSSVPGVLDVLELVELDVPGLAVDHLHLAQVDGLDRLPRGRIDRERPARAHPLHSLHGLDQLLAGRVGAR